MALLGHGQAQAAESVDINQPNNNEFRVASVGAGMGFGQGADGLNVIGQAQADEEAVSYAVVGTLLKGSGDGVFYVTEDGSRLHIYDWDSYLQYSFSPTDIVEIDDATQTPSHWLAR